jgi:hypothetical protein
VPAHASPTIRNEEVTLAPDGFYPLGDLRIISQFFAQMRNADVQQTVQAVIFATIEMLEQSGPRLDLSGVLREMSGQRFKWAARARSRRTTQPRSLSRGWQ